MTTLEVLMAVHASDRADWLEACLATLEAQTLRANRVRIIADGPLTDALETVLAQHSEMHAIVRQSLPVSSGLGAALAAGLEACDARFVARMDADDLARPDRFERQMAVLEATAGLAVVGSDAELFRDDKALGTRRMPVTNAEIRARVWTNPFVHSSVMFDRAAIIAVGGYDASLRTRQDYDLWFRCVAGGLLMQNIPEALVRYRVASVGKDRNLGVVWRQVRTGWRGCARVGAGPVAWLGVTAPLLFALLPAGVGRWTRGRLRAPD